MRGALVSLVVALVGAAAVAAAGFGAQDVLLPGLPPANRVAADAEAWLHYYRLSVDVFHSEGRKFSGACMRGWWLSPQPRGARGQRTGALWPGSVLAVRNGPVVLASGKHRVRQIYDPDRIGLPNPLAAAIGCTGPLSDALTQALQSGARLSIETTHAASQPAVALDLRLHSERLTLYLAPRSYRPLVVLGALGGQIASARIYLTRVTAARAAQFRRLVAKRLPTRRPEPTPRRALPG